MHYFVFWNDLDTAACRSPIDARWYKYDDHEVNEMPASSIKVIFRTICNNINAISIFFMLQMFSWFYERSTWPAIQKTTHLQM